MDAWETRYGEQRAAAIDRLEQLCLEKHHLKMPSATTNTNNKAKKKNVDISQLKAPTPSVSVAIEDASQYKNTTETKTVEDTIVPKQPETVQHQKVMIEKIPEQPEIRTPIKASKLSVTVKPHGLRTSFAPLGSGRLVTSNRKSSDSPEPMSIGGDSERSRSPSPIKDEETLRIDNANHISTSTTSSIAQQTDRSTSTDCIINPTNTATNINDLNANAVNDNVPNQAS